MDLKKHGIYLSGSISHDPEFVKKFALAERLIQEDLPEVFIFNPAAHQDLPADGKTEEELWAEYLCRDIIMLMSIADQFRMKVLVSISDNRTSKGSNLEREFAQRIGFHIMDIREFVPEWDELLAEELGGKA